MHLSKAGPREYALAEKKPFKAWNCLTGWVTYPTDNPQGATTSDGTKDPLAAVTKIMAVGDGQGKPFPDGFFVMQWPHWALPKVPALITCLADYARDFPETNKRLVLLVPESFSLPEELREAIPLLEFEVPTPVELRETYNTLVDVIRAEKRPRWSDAEIGRIVAAGQGLTAAEWEQSCARGFASLAHKLPNGVTPDEFASFVGEIKAEMVKRSECLEYVRDSASMDEVGGLETLKGWVGDRAPCFSDAAIAAGVDRPKGCALIGPPGCVSGETVVGYRRGIRNSSRPIDVETLYRKINGLPSSRPDWDLSLPTYLHSHDENSGRVFYSRIASVSEGGVRELLRVATASHEHIDLTPDHPVLTADAGYVEADRLRVGDRLIVRGSMQPQGSGGRKPRTVKRRVVDALKYHPFGAEQNIYDPVAEVTYKYQRVHFARLVVEADLNGMSVRELVHILKHDAARARTLRFILPGFDVHHIDENPRNDNRANLEVVERAEHIRRHRPIERFNIAFTDTTTVVAIDRIGKKATYDIKMSGPPSSFAVGSGFFLHDKSVPLVRRPPNCVAGGSILMQSKPSRVVVVRIPVRSAGSI